MWGLLFTSGPIQAFRHSPDISFSIMLLLKLGSVCPRGFGGHPGDVQHWRRNRSVQDDFPTARVPAAHSSFLTASSPAGFLSGISSPQSPRGTAPFTFWEVYLPILREISGSQDALPLSPFHSK